MKLLNFVLPAALIAVGDSFSVTRRRPKPTTSSSLTALPLERRTVLATVASVGSVLMIPTVSFAADEYVPQLKDMQQIYFLGESLDRLTAKVKDPDQLEAALSGVKQFNKQPNFYTGYAKNFVMKSVKKGSDSDPRVGYIRQASTLISSLESVLSGGDALMNEKSTTEEAVKRIQKAQSLIGRFLAESGVQDEKLAAFVAAHK
ncbi:hypothetical protein IV203_031580 [Nitzschia inconspicua]|uniref:Uncharacterized protein n=1 Tax=Nitzschia inconspicua TaxID=303405 RepID=A0A9K3LV40_9STRA|nr:hypothetical protein IV203_031580 [Nitzschia inconspicua]